eukprot:313992_1
MLDSKEAEQNIEDPDWFLIHWCMLLSDDIYSYKFNDNNHILICHILDLYLGYGGIQNAGLGLFYRVLLHLLLFNIFMTLIQLSLLLGRSGTIMIQMVLAIKASNKIYRLTFRNMYRLLNEMWCIILYTIYKIIINIKVQGYGIILQIL